MKFLQAHTALLLALATPCFAQETSTPYPGIRYTHIVHETPAASLHLFEIDLKSPNISLKIVPAGDGPSPDGKWQTTLLSVPEVAEREKFDLAINGDYFAAETPPDDGGLGALVKRGYRKGQRARMLKLAVTDGRPWSAGDHALPALLIGQKGDARIEWVTKAPADVWFAMGGLPLIDDGRLFGGVGKEERNAYTALGLDKARGTLVLLVADGLWQRRASGITVAELQAEMVKAGCFNAIMLDGGGSSTVVLRDPGTGTLKVLNNPTDGRPRAVAQALGVVVKR